MPEEQINEQGEREGQDPAGAPNETPNEEAPKVDPSKTDAPAGADQKDGDLPEWVLRERKELREEAARHRVKAKEIETAGAEAVAKVQKAFDDFKLERLRVDVVREVGLPDSAADRVKGSTKEEIEKDATDLARLVGSRSRQLSGGLSPANETDDGDIQARVKRVRQRR